MGWQPAGQRDNQTADCASPAGLPLLRELVEGSRFRWRALLLGFVGVALSVAVPRGVFLFWGALMAEGVTHHATPVWMVVLLQAVVVGAFGLITGHLLDETARVREALSTLAHEDPLTRLANRREFDRRFEEEMVRHQRTGAPLTLLMVDVDHFKRVNDSHGHVAGDEVLREVARCIRSCCRKLDVAVRYGGEEFAVILPDMPLDAAWSAAERLRTSIEGAVAVHCQTRIQVTASIGVASTQQGPEMTTGSALMARADEALFRAKRSGRNRVCG